MLGLSLSRPSPIWVAVSWIQPSYADSRICAFAGINKRRWSVVSVPHRDTRSRSVASIPITPEYKKNKCPGYECWENAQWK